MITIPCPKCGSDRTEPTGPMLGELVCRAPGCYVIWLLPWEEREKAEAFERECWTRGWRPGRDYDPAWREKEGVDG